MLCCVLLSTGLLILISFSFSFLLKICLVGDSGPFFFDKKTVVFVVWLVLLCCGVSLVGSWIPGGRSRGSDPNADVSENNVGERFWVRSVIWYGSCLKRILKICGGWVLLFGGGSPSSG